MKRADIGVIGLAVMGQNLVLNLADKGFTVAVFNRSASKVDDLLSVKSTKHSLLPSASLKEFTAVLSRPRKILLMIKAGEAVDEMIDQLVPFLEKGDILIDGGNSYYVDTERRCKRLKEKGLLYVGAGVSGGEEGARHGPSLMVGGEAEAWPFLKPFFEKIAARSEKKDICAGWVGGGGAGHFVKMVHNGIEYADMQIIAEGYDLLKNGLMLSNEEMSEIFSEWNQGPLQSYLIEITSHVLKAKDEEGYIIDRILDVAGQKGTGKWTVIDALTRGVSSSVIAEAVFMRNLSSFKELRMKASSLFSSSKKKKSSLDKKAFIEKIKNALYAAKIICYAQGFSLVREASQQEGWGIDLSKLALLWTGGCIIRSRFLYEIARAFHQTDSLQALLLDEYFRKELMRVQEGWRETVIQAIFLEIPTPCLSSSLAFFDGFRKGTLSTELIQAQRDFFGAHTYEKKEMPRGVFYHTNWQKAEEKKV